MGELSSAKLSEMTGQINNLQFSSLYGSGICSYIYVILDSFINNITGLSKLKLSKINLHDDRIVETLCQLIELSKNLTSLDISWGSLSSKHMFMIAKSFNDESGNVLMNLNLSYNSLTFIEPTNKHRENFYNSEDFFE